MKKNWSSLIPFLLAVCVLVGCGKDEAAKKPKRINRDVTTFAGMEPGEVFARVGQATLTKQDVLDNISAMTKLACHKAGDQRSERRDKVIEANVKTGILPQFAQMQQMAAVISTNPVKIAKATYEDRLNSFYTNFTVKSEGPAQVRALLTAAEQKVIERTVNSQLELEAYVRQNCTNLTVTEFMITNALGKVRRWNDMIDATNAYAEATAKKISKLLEAGEDFGKLADRYSSDPEKKPGGLVDDHAAVWFSDGKSSYLDDFDKMKPGEVSSWLPSVEGKLIVKALGPDEKTKMPLYQRIVLQKGEKYPEYTRAEIVRMGTDELLAKAYSEVLKAAAEAVSVEYPHGADFFAKDLERERARARMYGTRRPGPFKENAIPPRPTAPAKK